MSVRFCHASRRRAPFVALALGLAAVALSGCTAALGTIRGTLPPARAPGSIVMAWPVDAGTPYQGTGYARIDQTKNGFVPKIAIVEAGTTVVFHNEDHVYHSVFSVLPEGPFDLEAYAPGKTTRVRLSAPGVYPIFCELHPKESAQIVVTPNRWHGRPRADGRFTLDDVPQGTYRVRVWHPNRKDLEATVEVKAGGTGLVEFSN